VNTILAVYRNSINFLYSQFYILSIKSHYSYLNIFSILLPITTFYRLTIVSLYRHIYTKYIQITYNITYKGSLDFAIPSMKGRILFNSGPALNSQALSVICLSAVL
jgi:hypothetical protein